MTLLMLVLLAQVVPSPPADATVTRRGLVNTNTQSFSGQKRFLDGGIVTNGLTVDGGAVVNGSLVVDGGITVNGGFALQTVTTATMTLYVDTTGSDANACTASGSSACLTLGGAFAKIPNVVRHNVTVNVAAGTYAENLNLASGLYLSNGVTLAVTGALATHTPATGTSSGTTTAASAGSASGPASMTDSGQGWTTNELKGRMVQFGSGSLNGQALPIVSNTATAITISGSTSPGVGVSYSLVTPSVIFAQPANGTIANVDGRGTLAWTSVDITSASSSGIIYRGPTGLMTFTHSRIITSSTIGSLNVQAGTVTLTRSYVYNSGAGNAFYGVGSSYGQTPMLGGTFFFVRATSGGAYTGVQYSITTSATPFVAEVTTGTGVKLLNPVSSMSAAGVWVTCSTAGSGTGISVGSLSTTTIGASAPVAMFNGGSRITGCGTGLAAYDSARAVVGAMAFDTVTTALVVAKGGVVDFNATTPTFTGVTNELSYDGTTATFASLVAAGPPAVLSNAYGSRFIR